MKGVLDRFEGEIAVILVEEVKEQFHVKKESLPSGSDVNTLFRVSKTNGDFHIVEIDRQATRQQKTTTSDLMNKLRAKKSGSKFKRK